MLRSSLSFLFAFLVVPVFFASLPTKADAASLLYSNDFEKGLGNVSFQWKCRSDQFKVVSSPARTGKHSIRINQPGNKVCHDGNNSSSRVKHRSFVVLGSRNLRFKQEQTYWVGFSVYLPSNFPTKNKGVSLWSVTNGKPQGEAKIMLRSNWEFYAQSNPANGSRKSTQIAKVPPKKGAWTDIVLEIRRSLKGKGVYRAWVNGKKVGEFKGNLGGGYEQLGKKGPYPRVGMYWGEKTRRHNYTLYIDSVKIAEGANGYDLVATSRSGSVKPPRPVQNVRLSN